MMTSGKTALIARVLAAMGAAAVAGAGRAASAAEPTPLYSSKTKYVLTPAQSRELRQQTDALETKVRGLEDHVPADLLADVAIYPKAAEYVLHFPDRVNRPVDYQNALDVVALGKSRADELDRAAPSWPTARGLVGRGYRSKVDDSFQPYCVGVPEGYDPKRPMRLDVILHGRSVILNEASFLTSVQTGRIVATEPSAPTKFDCLKLYVFGRGNTSYRWAGEADVFEALAAVEAHYNVDRDRIVLRGFSMGGAGAWHLGLHFPSRWAAVEAGAGFVETRPEVLATIHEPWRLTALAIHDASNCAENLVDLPFVAYAGSLDPTLEQNEIVEHRLTAAGVDWAKLPEARFLIGEGVGHKFRPDRKQESSAFIAASLPRRRPANFTFVTYTPSYGEFWDFHVDSLDRLYERAEIRGTWDKVTTQNIWVLRLDQARSLELDGQRLAGEVFERRDGAWRAGAPAGLRKRAGLQGPIDDAFQQPFLCVPPTGGADAELERCRADFGRYLFGDVRVKAAESVTAQDIANYNLVLFGTPQTNPLLRRILPQLPLRWDEREIALGARRFPAAGLTVAMIYPNPLNPQRYVVLNSGFTFPGRSYDDMHWFLHPRLGDYAVLDAQTREVKLAGFFDRSWKY